MIATTLAVLHWLWLAIVPGAHPQQDEIDRLIGHSIHITSDTYQIIDIAGEGPARVGCVFKRDGELRFVASGESQQWSLTGPLALARIAGPNYKVWILAEKDGDSRLFVRRLGILASPATSKCAGLGAN